ncbi:hypothetical protein EDD66_103115 [Mobilisporobacter senegalensis]|uniref:Uncharacterized protein n=1 Tax=Mobilisporobacter senegalensis TaxID=1329262 RepID=A0A3N1XR86_9FIRM|nr:hypothetical protein [Mobilisporobacter senegalensis]ROR29180.1 hypothetical protein EDD66_103115 [Mobilisporobacter senegalensis]
MENIWTKINDNIPGYMQKINKQYNMTCIKISPLKTAMIGEGFALIIAIDRFDANVSYVYKVKDEFIVLLCDNYFAEKYDTDDRKDLLSEDGAETSVINNLIVISNGLISKWNNVLSGENEWIADYKKSRWYAVGKMTPDEMRIIEKYI